MKGKGFAIGFAVICLAQAAIAGGLVVLARLARSKAGVNHHVLFRKQHYDRVLFTPANVWWMRAALILLAAALVCALLLLLRRHRPWGAALCALSLLAAGCLLWQLSSPGFHGIRIFPYAVLGTAVCLALNLLSLLLWGVLFRAKRRNHS